MARILLVVAPWGFRDEEALVPKARFEAAGHGVTVASTKAGPARGTFDAWLHADLSLAEARAGDWDAVVFAGGQGAPALVEDPSALRLCRDASAAGKVLAGLCASASVLAEAGVLEGRRATCWPDRRAHLESKGAVWCDEGVVTDPSGIVTGDGPARAAAFADAVMKVLKGRGR
jgi:protease I